MTKKWQRRRPRETQSAGRVICQENHATTKLQQWQYYDKNNFVSIPSNSRLTSWSDDAYDYNERLGCVEHCSANYTDRQDCEIGAVCRWSKQCRCSIAELVYDRNSCMSVLMCLHLPPTHHQQHTISSPTTGQTNSAKATSNRLRVGWSRDCHPNNVPPLIAKSLRSVYRTSISSAVFEEAGAWQTYRLSYRATGSPVATVRISCIRCGPNAAGTER